jgi:hypothetical protein
MLHSDRLFSNAAASVGCLLSGDGSVSGFSISIKGCTKSNFVMDLRRTGATYNCTADAFGELSRYSDGQRPGRPGFDSQKR